MLIYDNGFTRDLYASSVDPFQKIPIQSVKPATLFNFESLRQNPAALQSNTQYTLFGKFLITSNDTTAINSSSSNEFVDTLFSLNSSIWPSFFYSQEENLLFLFNATVNAQLQTSIQGGAESIFMVERMYGDASIGSFCQLATPDSFIIQTHPTLILSNQFEDVPLHLDYNLPPRKITSNVLAFSTTFAFDQDFSLNTNDDSSPFLQLISASNDFDSFAFSACATNCVEFVFNSITCRFVLSAPTKWNTITFVLYDLHTSVPKLQLFQNGRSAHFNNFTILDNNDLAQGFYGILRTTCISASTVRYQDMCAMSFASSTDAFDFARLKALTFASSIDNFFFPSGRSFAPNSAHTSLVTNTSNYFMFTAASSPFPIDPNTSGPIVEPGQIFTSSWTSYLFSSIHVKMEFYLASAAVSNTQSFAILKWSNMSLVLTAYAETSTSYQLSLMIDDDVLVKSVIINNVVAGFKLDMYIKINSSINKILCSSLINICCNSINLAYNFDASSINTNANLIVCNQPTTNTTPTPTSWVIKSLEI